MCPPPGAGGIGVYGILLRFIPFAVYISFTAFNVSK